MVPLKKEAVFAVLLPLENNSFPAYPLDVVPSARLVGPIA